MDSIVLDSLRDVTLVLGSLLAFFALADPFIYPAFQARIALVDALAAASFFALHLLLRRHKVPARLANPMAALLAFIVLVDVSHDVWLLGDPEQTVYLMVTVMGTGAILLSRLWTPLVIGVVFVTWAAMASFHADEGWITMGFGLFAASVLGLLIHAVRLTTLGRLESARLRERVIAESLARSEESYRSLVEDAPEGILVHRDDRVLYANPAALRLFGASSLDELRRVSPTLLVHEEDRPHAREYVQQVRSEGRAREPRQLRIVRLDGQVAHVETVGQHVVYDGEPAEQTLLRDVTDRQRAEEERRVAAERLAEVRRLQELEQVRTQLVSAVTHELRTPLTPIRVQLHLLKQAGSDEPRRQRATQVIERNVERLGRIVEELLEVARIQSGRLRVEREDLDLTVVVSQAVEAYAEVAREKSIALVSDIDVGVPVSGDAQRLAQVMDNLLGNAFKFTPEGGRVEVSLKTDADGALVRVRDSGRGIEPAARARLFQPFSQLHESADQLKGTGLGLFIARGFIEGHGGTIWCESEGVGDGATFAFRLPGGTPPSPAGAPSAAAASDADDEGAPPAPDEPRDEPRDEPPGGRPPPAAPASEAEGAPSSRSWRGP